MLKTGNTGLNLLPCQSTARATCPKSLTALATPAWLQKISKTSHQTANLLVFTVLDVVLLRPSTNANINMAVQMQWQRRRLPSIRGDWTTDSHLISNTFEISVLPETWYRDGCRRMDCAIWSASTSLFPDQRRDRRIASHHDQQDSTLLEDTEKECRAEVRPRPRVEDSKSDLLQKFSELNNADKQLHTHLLTCT